MFSTHAKYRVLRKISLICFSGQQPELVQPIFFFAHTKFIGPIFIMNEKIEKGLLVPYSHELAPLDFFIYTLKIGIFEQELSNYFTLIATYEVRSGV